MHTLAGWGAELMTLDAERTAGDAFSFDVHLADDEPLASPPIVRVGGVAVACEPVASRDDRWQCTHTPDPEVEDGVKTITVELVDAAGNADTIVIGQIEYDRSPPVLVNPVVTPELAAAGSRVQVRFSFDEPVHDVALEGDLSWTAIQEGERDFLYERVVGADDAEGTFPLTVSARDALGNPLEHAQLGELTIDTTAPSLTLANIDKEQVVAGEPFLVIFTSSEPLGLPARLFIGAEEVGPAEPPYTRALLAA